jgi:GT2 family glycosyltransferase
MCFSWQVLERLLSHNKDIVGANYNRRSYPSQSLTLFKCLAGTYYNKELPKTLFECDAIGTGCLLIKADVFKKISKPWFFYGAEDRMIGEDIYFCEKAKEAGFKIWCDPNLEVGHLGEYIY